MSRKLFAVAAAAAVVGCSSADETRPSPYTPPAFLISDGTHSNGNPDFFWLPPLVKDPSGSANFDVGKFNPDLDPVITICAMPGTREQDIDANTQCIPGGYFVTSPSAEVPAPTVNITNEFYQTAWTVPVSSDVFYRIRVAVGSKVIGIGDLHSVPGPSQLKSVNQNNFFGQQDGSNLPLKFRIERAALCDPPGVYPCNSAGVALTDGKDVLTDTQNGNGGSGVHIPGQPNRNEKVTITVDDCDNLNPRATDLPTFGSCIRVTSDPALTAPLAVVPTVFICDVGPALPSGMSEDQEKRITLHQLDVVNGQNVVKALPHIAGCPQIQAQSSFKNLFQALAHRHWKQAGRQLAGLLSPKPLYARIDQGGGGEVADGGFSDFQFALPSKMEISAGNAQSVAILTSLPIAPAVLVTDLGGTPVANATVHFATSDGSVAPTSFTTGADGLAATGWTLSGTVGPQAMTASGRGIAGSNANGPRSIFDPFMAIQGQFNPAGDPVPDPLQSVLLQTGTQGFAASGFIPFGSSGYSYKVIASNDADPTGWQLSGFNEAVNGFSTGATAPFASTGNPCTYAHPTSWPKKTDILVRKTFNLGSAQAVTLRVAMDKDIVEVFLNGVAMAGGPSSHSGCAVPGAADNSVFTGTGAAGTNLIAIRASARSTSAFFDLKVTAP